jgi:hypothetical protein
MHKKVGHDISVVFLSSFNYSVNQHKIKTAQTAALVVSLSHLCKQGQIKEDFVFPL